MSETTGGTVSAILVGVVVGGITGVVYFGMLWRTVQHLPSRRSPVAWLVGSALARLAVLGLALVVVVRGRLAGLLAFLIAVMVARSILVRRLQRSGGPRQSAASPAGE